MFEQTITHQFLKALEHMEIGSMHVTTPDGKSYQFSGKKPGEHATMYIRDWRSIPAFAVRGDIGFAEAYRDGWWDSDDLTKTLLVCLQNEAALESYIYGGTLGRIASRIAYLFRHNTINGSKKNIHAHYDIGNEFYSQWLDETMTYSSAIYRHPNESLAEAQHNKYDRIIERLSGRSGRLLEVGCGWGGFAERAADKGDFAIKGITLSNAQHDYATKRLENKATVALEDYRLQQGRYDNIVSIEMFEAVGERFWPVYFGKMKSLLAEKGKAVIQTITVGDAYFERYRRGGDFIRTYIFPGGMLPSPTRFEEETQKADLRITDQFRFGKDYARTLSRWLENFERKRDIILTMGFDEPFIRLWRMYLAACIASFQVGRTDVMQVELQHA